LTPVIGEAKLRKGTYHYSLLSLVDCVDYIAAGFSVQLQQLVDIEAIPLVDRSS
jgi:hypothetical protein